MMKARQYNRRILSDDTACHVYSIQESNSINRKHLAYLGNSLSKENRETALNQITELLDTFIDAKEYGSILDVKNYNRSLLRAFAIDNSNSGQMQLDAIGISETQKALLQLIDMGEVMAQKYEIVVTNPPYMAIGNASPKASNFVFEHFSKSKSDLFAVFMIFKYLLSDDNFRLLMKELEYEIEALDGKVDVIPIGKILDYMGFPKNYMDIVKL